MTDLDYLKSKFAIFLNCISDEDFKVTSKNISPKAKKYGIIEPTNKVGDLDAVESICRR